MPDDVVPKGSLWVQEDLGWVEEKVVDVQVTLHPAGSLVRDAHWCLLIRRLHFRPLSRNTVLGLQNTATRVAPPPVVRTLPESLLIGRMS